MHVQKRNRWRVNSYVLERILYIYYYFIYLNTRIYKEKPFPNPLLNIEHGVRSWEGLWTESNAWQTPSRFNFSQFFGPGPCWCVRRVRILSCYGWVRLSEGDQESHWVERHSCTSLMWLKTRSSMTESVKDLTWYTHNVPYLESTQENHLSS